MFHLCVANELTDLSKLHLQVYLRYVVLNFTEQNEVEVAPSSWLERIDGVGFSPYMFL